MNAARLTALLSLTAVLSLVGWRCASGGMVTRRSISGWASCTGVADDTDAVARALAAARHDAFTLVVDCPVRLRIGVDIARTLYIDDGTTVEFTGAGKFTVDNVFHPAFVIANTKDVTLKNWNLEYDASLPVDMKTGGYENAGKFVASNGNAPPAGAFSDFGISRWLTANRSILFDKTQGNAGSIWIGPTNTSAVFFITGDTSNVKVSGMRLYVPAAAGGDRFIPMAFSLSANYRSGQRINARTPRTSQFVAIPHDLAFTDIDLDGIYMGWQGNAQNVVFERIRSHRYGDLQDAKGENVGGIGKWFAPPHLFYLNYLPGGDPGLFTRNLRLHDIVDAGPRVGVARDKGGADTVSGYDMSLKIGGVDCSVDTYTSRRPDGFADVLTSDRLTISNVDATYDSAFLNNLWSGWRFPQAPYKRVTIRNVVFKDLAATSVQPPIADTTQPANENIVLSNVSVEMNHWSGKGLPVATISGQGNDVALEYIIPGDATRISSVQKGTMAVMLQSVQTTTNLGRATVLNWTSKGVDACSASGAWDGSLPGSGTRTVADTLPGSHELTLACTADRESISTTLRVDSPR